MQTCRLPLYSTEPGDEDLVIYLGFDPAGVALEVMAVELEDALLVIHAMKLRAKYQDAFEEVLGRKP